MARMTTYEKAVNWLNGSLILCNDIAEKDSSIWDNIRFEMEENTEIYQWFLTSFSDDDVEWLEKTFALKFTYSELLGLYVLCVDFWGTSWDSVECECFDDSIPAQYL